MSASVLVRVLVFVALVFAAGPSSSAPPTSASEPVAEEARATHVVLPCGLRVIVARDASLPVAAVALAVDVGTEDDPEDNPGLIHALAVHLQAGNRELQPGEALANAHDNGGLATMAVGHAQVRFESLVPISQLDRTLWIESQRLRAPTISQTLWRKSLGYARADRRPKFPVPPEVLAGAWQRPGLAHDGHVAPEKLGKMLDEAIAAQLGKNFDYRRSTLAVVSPRDPEKVLARVTELFADLPTVPRETRELAVPPPEQDPPRRLESVRQKGDTLVWPIAGTPVARVQAELVCAALNRQRRRADEGPSARLRCTYVDDARRSLLAVRAMGVDDPAALVVARLARLAAGDDVDIVSAQKERLRRQLRQTLHGPVALCRRLGQADPSLSTSTPETTALGRLTGAQGLDDPDAFGRHTLATDRASLLVAPAEPDDTGGADREAKP